jgi:Leu/Phe-tRNA-protein transferase
MILPDLFLIKKNIEKSTKNSTSFLAEKNMIEKRIRFLPEGYMYIDQQDDLDFIVRVIGSEKYDEEFCISQDFSPSFLANLMSRGFLVMSLEVPVSENDFVTILMPKHHIIRNVLFFDKLHISKTTKRFLNQYELKVDDDFELMLQHCVKTHGDGWLTKELCSALVSLWKNPIAPIKMFAFGLYRDNKLVAGEIGVVAGKVYTSYSGFRTENNSGSVQMIKTAKYLEENGFHFWDLGMPLDYKYTFGAIDIFKHEFEELFEKAQVPSFPSTF